MKVRIFPRASSGHTLGALGKSGLSRLTFNQETRGFESHTPRHELRRILSHVDRSSTEAERRAVTAEVEGSTPFDPPQAFGALGESGRSRLRLKQESAGSNPARAVKTHETFRERWLRGEALDCRSSRCEFESRPFRPRLRSSNAQSGWLLTSQVRVRIPAKAFNFRGVV
jgi:hypothetical protein